MRYRIFKLIDVLAHKPGLFLPCVNKHAHRQGVIVLERIEINLIRIPEGWTKNHQFRKVGRMDDADIRADQTTHAAPSYPGINPVCLGPVMGVDIGFQGFDDKIGVILPLAVPEFPVEIGAILLDPLLSAMVDPDDDQLSGAGGRHLHQVPVDRPAPKWGSVVKQVLGILEV